MGLDLLNMDQRDFLGALTAVCDGILESLLGLVVGFGTWGGEKLDS